MVLCGADDHLNNVWQPKAAKDLLTNLILTTILQMIQCRLPLLQEEPQIFSSEIGIDCTYVHIIVNILRFIKVSSHQQRITRWNFIEFIIDGFIKKYVLKQDIWIWRQSNIKIFDIGRPEFNMARSAQILQYLHICIKMLYLMTLCYM